MSQPVKIIDNNDLKQTKNWVNLTQNVKSKSRSDKERHIQSLIKRKETNPQDSQKPQFIQLLHKIRTMCIIKAYFPKDTRYNDMFLDIHTKTHPGWNDFMTDYERTLLNDFYLALLDIERYHNTRKFDVVDKKFGDYRYEKWLKSVQIVD
jgi:hypothetical protein